MQGRENGVEIDTLLLVGAENSLDALLERISYRGPIRQVTYARRGRDWIVVAGRDDSKKYYFMAKQDGAAVKAFSMSYPEELASTYERMTVAMANTFRPAETNLATEAGR